MKLNSISAIKNKNKIRPGRGIGSGKGKTSGRGHKGQKSRSGVSINSFEGGQMPLYRRLPKRGFKPNSKKKFAIINLSVIQKLISTNKITEKDQISLSFLQKGNFVDKKYTKLKILGTGDLDKKINVLTNQISASARSKIEKKGGIVSLNKDKENVPKHKNL